MFKRKAISILTAFVLMTALCAIGVPVVVAGGSTTWYFAEGYTGEGFDTWLTLENPNTTDATATITYYFGDGSTPLTKSMSMPMLSRQTVSVNDDVGADKEVSIKVESTQGVVAERPMYFNFYNRKPGGHTTLGAKATSTTWYFAEGYTGEHFYTWLTLQNPNTHAADVTITYMFEGGATPVTKNISVAAQSRETIDVNADVGDNKQVSIKVESNKGIVAERPMYFNYQNKWAGGHNTIGSNATSATWYFAEGFTGEGFDTWLTLQNPGGTDATATVTYYYRGGGTLVTTKNISANSRETIDVSADAGENKEVSIKVEADQSIVAERPVYFNYRNKWSGGHNTMGVTSTGQTWYFAEGSAEEGFETWLTLQNPNATSATVLVYYLSRTMGTALLKVKTVPANSRETISVNNDVGEWLASDTAIWITSTKSLVAERPMYFNYQDKWTGGHNTVGYRSSSGPSIP